MELFIDTASIEDIREIARWGCLSGVTTNPSLIAKEEGGFTAILEEITQLVDGPISAEVVSATADEMVPEARVLAALHPNIIIKVPMCAEGLGAARRLADEGIRTNVTLVFSANQALLAARAGASFVSVFMGRLDDIGHDSVAILREVMDAYGNYEITSKVIAASIRHPVHVTQAALVGADIATIPPKVLRQMVRHPLTDAGIKAFNDDWAAVQAAGRVG
ncbi:MAG: fructose-6-phosphate aldolase [Thermoleophilia bacterium]